MNKDQLAAKLAREAGLTRAAAADQLDTVIHDILARLRRGKPAPFPGLGRFDPGGGFHFEAPAEQPRRRRS
jgi:nucleoid DNA-binding protein